MSLGVARRKIALVIQVRFHFSWDHRFDWWR